MEFEDYEKILYQQEDGSWVAEIPVLPACYALMKTPEEAKTERRLVFEMIMESLDENRHG